MAVFGAPLAHEDDAERAVRAGLRILDAIGELNAAQPNLELRVRIGIQSGEAMVDRDARPDRGEGIVTGDVVNTAARLQSVARSARILVGEATYRLTKRVRIRATRVRAGQGEGGSARDLASARGPRPLRHGPQRRACDATDRPRAGVDAASERLCDGGRGADAATGDGCRRAGHRQEPARLGARRVHRFAAGARALATGPLSALRERNAFWRLGEIVKAEAGIWESDSPEEAAAKLEATLPRDDPDRPWLRARSAPLRGCSRRARLAGRVVHGVAPAAGALGIEPQDGARVRRLAMGE